MKKILTFILLILIVDSRAQSTVIEPTDKPTVEIDKLREGLVESSRKGDIDKLLTYLDPNVVVTWQNGEVSKGREEVRAYYNRMMTGNQKIVREITSAPEVLGRHIYGDWAVSWGNLHDHFLLTDGSDLPFNSVFTATIARRGDAWLVTAFHVSVNAFDNPVLKMAVKKTTLYVGLAAGAAGVIAGLAVALFVRRRAKSVA